MIYYIYVWKLNQTVLELDFRAVKFLFSYPGYWLMKKKQCVDNTLVPGLTLCWRTNYLTSFSIRWQLKTNKKNTISHCMYVLQIKTHTRRNDIMVSSHNITGSITLFCSHAILMLFRRPIILLLIGTS
jgi:hypothetical protein